ncbi:ROK family protein [Polaromonas sp.]|nr:ROK family protein [Candidatus Saccharibacteria bacterium]
MTQQLPEVSYELLTEEPVPDLVDAQLDEFTLEALHTQTAQQFDPVEASKTMAANEGRFVLGADLGGDKGAVRLFQIVNGELITQSGYEGNVQGNDGAGYVQLLKEAAVYAEEQSICLGISWGGPLVGTKPIYHPKAKIFFQELKDQFDGDLQRISPRVTAAVNDGPAGAISGALQAYRQYNATNTIFVINGGGIGTSVVKDGIVYAAEAGHVRGVDALNTYAQSTPCGVYDNSFVCLERLGANKAGIEDQWLDKTGAYMRARDIEDEYKAGNRFAAELYDHSALVLAHVITGTAKAFELSLQDVNTVIVGHGGAFKFPAYGARIGQIIAAYVKAQPRLIMTKDFGATNSNACLDGAAIAAICNN